MAVERSRRVNASSKMASLMNSMEHDDFYTDFELISGGKTTTTSEK